MSDSGQTESHTIRQEPAWRSRRRRFIGTLVSLWLAVNVVAWFGTDAWRWLSVRLQQHRTRRIAQFYKQREYEGVTNQKTPFHLPYLLFTPLAADSASYPLVVVLHGSGERGNDLTAILPTLGTFLVEADCQRRHPCFVAAPQCPSQLSWRSLTSVDMTAVVSGLISELVGLPGVDPNRVYLIGYSMGGYGCWHLAATTPEQFAAIVPVAGGGDTAAAERLASVPAWAIHGKSDRVVSCEESQQMVEAVNAQGGQARLTLLPEVGHDSWKFVQQTPNEYLDWLFSHRRAS